MSKVRVAAASRIPDGETLRVEADGRAILLARVGGRICAIDAICSHQGGDLGDGPFDGECVTCPLHEAVFEVATGKSLTSLATDQECFAVSVEGDDVYVAVRL